VRRDLTWPVLIGWTTVVGLTHLVGPSAVSWHSFVRGTRALLSPAAAHLYAQHSALQIGPVAYLADAPIVLAFPGAAGRVVAMGAVSALGLLVVAQLERLARPADRAARWRFVGAAMALLLVWEQLAVTYVHPDDALALLLALLALGLVRADRPLLAALLLALAADSKPWALAFVPILALARTRRGLAAAVWTGGVAVAWLPFYLLDPRSTAATSYRIRNVATSSLRILGVHTGWTPSWDRPVQITLGAALALLVVRRKRWPAVILVAVCARLLLDPSTKSYYDAGLLVGSMLCDLLLVAGPVPLFSVSALLLFSAPRALLGEEPHFYGQLRTAYLLAVIGVLLMPRRWIQVAGAHGPTPEIRSTA